MLTELNEYPKHMLKLKDKEKTTTLRYFLLNRTYAVSRNYEDLCLNVLIYLKKSYLYYWCLPTRYVVPASYYLVHEQVQVSLTSAFELSVLASGNLQENKNNFDSNT